MLGTSGTTGPGGPEPGGALGELEESPVPACPPRRQTEARSSGPQAGAAGDAAPQPGKGIPPRPFGGKFGPGAEKRGLRMLVEDADLSLKRRVALLGATLKAQPSGWRAKMRGALQLPPCPMCPGQSRRSQMPSPVFSNAPGEVT